MTNSSVRTENRGINFRTDSAWVVFISVGLALWFHSFALASVCEKLPTAGLILVQLLATANCQQRSQHRGREFRLHPAETSGEHRYCRVVVRAADATWGVDSHVHFVER